MPRRCMSSAAITAAPTNGATRSGLSAFQDTPYSRTPRATAATAMVPRLRSRPMTSAANARTSVEMLNALPSGTPRIPARRNRAKNDSSAASIQTTVESQPTGMPRSDARSLRSAAARTAVPTRVRVRKSPTTTMATGATIIAMKSLPLRMNEPMVSFQSTGGGMRCEAALSSQSRGMRIAKTARSCVTPIVATVRTSRGDRANRRMIANSTNAPRTTDAPRPAARPRRYGSPENTMIPTDNAAGMNPRSAWAKFRTRFARYTSAMPTARSAVRSPITTPRIQAPSGTPKNTNCTTTRTKAGVRGASERRADAARSAQRLIVSPSFPPTRVVYHTSVWP